MEPVLSQTNTENSSSFENGQSFAFTNVDIKQEKLDLISSLKSDNDSVHDDPDQSIGNGVKDESEPIKPEEDEEEDYDEKEPVDQCEHFVEFSIVCSFFQQFGTQLGINYSIESLKNLLEDPKGN
jgi:hypothetical protein